MLFSIKNRLGPTLLLVIGLVTVSCLLRTYLGIRWRLAFSGNLAAPFALGLGLLLASDGLIQSALRLLFRERYLSRYRALAEYFLSLIHI